MTLSDIYSLIRVCKRSSPKVTGTHSEINIVNHSCAVVFSFNQTLTYLALAYYYIYIYIHIYNIYIIGRGNIQLDKFISLCHSLET